MQVTLDAVDWEQLTSFCTAEKFLEWFQELEDENEFRTISCYGHGWASDSASQYFGVAAALEHLSVISDSDTAVHLREGIQKLIAESSQIDEFGMTQESDGCYWISACPVAVAKIKAHIDAVDFQQCVDLLTTHPPPDEDEIITNPDEMFLSFIEQHSRMVNIAVSNGYGLLGHCG